MNQGLKAHVEAPRSYRNQRRWYSAGKCSIGGNVYAGNSLLVCHHQHSLSESKIPGGEKSKDVANTGAIRGEGR